MPLVNLKTVLLCDRRHVRPDLVAKLEEAADCGFLIVDKSVMNAFQPLYFFEPVAPQDYKSLMLVSNRGMRPEVMEKLTNAKNMEIIPVDPTLLDAFQPIFFAKDQLPKVDAAGKVTERKKKPSKKKKPTPKET